MSGFLADEKFPGLAGRSLRDAGHDVSWVREDAPSSADEAVLARAIAEKRVLLTFDKDFGELAFRRGLPAACGIVLFRIPMSPPGPGVDRIVATILSRGDWSGLFSVIEPGRIRERSL